MKVTLIDPLDKPGGTCLYLGCIPSKALLHVARLITDVQDVTPWGIKLCGYFFSGNRSGPASVEGFCNVGTSSGTSGRGDTLGFEPASGGGGVSLELVMLRL